MCAIYLASERERDRPIDPMLHMDLSLGTLVEVEDSQEVPEEDNNLYKQQRALGQDLHRRQGVSGGGPSHSHGVEREHMFDKVLTPSDVGKLNRLVVPKQHAERFFPAAGAGSTQLCFQDRGGALWQFRYSYWGSSQSYVMTKGWSRFVRAARLAAGDTVTFSRSGGGRYFIEYRHCQRRRRDVDISFGDAATVPAWPRPIVIGTAAMNNGGATVASATIAGHDIEVAVAPSGARSFRLFGFNVECSGDDAPAPAPAPAEVEYVDGDT